MTETLATSSLIAKDGDKKATAKTTLNKFIGKDFFNGDCFAIALCASRRSGKTTLLKHLLHKYVKYDKLILIGASINNGIYAGIETKFRYEKYNNDYVKEIMKIQRGIMRGGKKPPHVVFVLDDCVNVKYMSTLTDIFLTGRNSNVSIFFCAQNSTLLSTDHRNNLDALIVLKEHTSTEIDSLVTKFFMGNLKAIGLKAKNNAEESRIWRDFIEENTGDYNSIVLNYKTDKNSIWRYRAPA